MKEPHDKHSKERFKAAKQLMAHLVADQTKLTHAWTEGNKKQSSATNAHATQNLKSTSNLMNLMKAGETRLAQNWLKGNQQQSQNDTASALKNIKAAKILNQAKTTSITSWGENFVLGQKEAQQLAGQGSSDVSNSFQTFTAQAARGQLNLTQAASSLGKLILQDVLESVASTLINKGETELAIGAALLSGVLTAPLAATPLIVGGIELVAGEALQMTAATLLAKGALVVRPTLAVIGEGQQPEAVIPASRFAEFGLTGGMQLGTLKMTFPDMTSLSDTNHPDFRNVVSQELQAAYQAANEGKN